MTACSAHGHSGLQETRLSALRPPSEFFDYHRLSRPADMNQATSVCPSFRDAFVQHLTHCVPSAYHIIPATSLVSPVMRIAIVKGSNHGMLYRKLWANRSCPRSLRTVCHSPIFRHCRSLTSLSKPHKPSPPNRHGLSCRWLRCDQQIRYVPHPSVSQIILTSMQPPSRCKLASMS
jgi:hypothetical protein